MVNRGKTTCWVSGQLFSRGFHAFPGRFPGRGGGYLILLLAWPCCCSRLGLLWFSELGLQDFQVVGLLGVVGPRSLKLPGVHHSPSRSPQSLPLPFPQPAVSSFPAARSLSSYPGFITPLPPSFNGASRLVGLLRREEEVHRPELPRGVGAYASGRPANATSSQWAMGHQRSSALAPRGVSSRLRPNGNLAPVR